ncbi:peptidoglycan DD-metalloendopeptidase family protein [Candidatus Falkowbacteria bacterium]|nr:peptidoglycan DD-metalloendopeptidase family protein [Candidatus Falkowbacteria bacterium]
MAQKGLKVAIILTAISLLVPFNFSLIQAAKAEEAPANALVGEISNLDKEIDAKRKEIEALQQKSDGYKKQIEAAQKKTASLSTELAILSNRIAKIKIDIETTEKKIETITLEIKNLETQILDKENSIAKSKDRIAEFLRLIHRNDEKSYLEVIATNQSFSEVFDQMKYVENLQADLQNTLNQVQELKAELEEQKKQREDKKAEAENSKNEMVKMQSSLEEQIQSKEVLLDKTYDSEKQFQNWLLQSKYEEEQINAEITALERTIRQRLEESDKAFSEGQSGSVALSWPVDPGRGITATFHDPDYPFRYIFEHPAIDIRAYQGTPIKAPAPGYVGKIKNGGQKGYSYIMLLHANGLSTVYGHVSKINVQEDTYVIRGQVIGLSGGMPGTPGAGPLTTGPHLHFETRLDGIPVNPLDYLP